jgi:hypothetical protein
VRDRPELTVLDAIVLLEISPEQAHDGPNLLDALAGFVDRFRVVRDLVAADFLERLLKFPGHDARQLPGNCPPPFESVCHVHLSRWLDPGMQGRLSRADHGVSY